MQRATDSDRCRCTRAAWIPFRRTRGRRLASVARTGRPTDRSPFHPTADELSGPGAPSLNAEIGGDSAPAEIIDTGGASSIQPGFIDELVPFFANRLVTRLSRFSQA